MSPNVIHVESQGRISMTHRTTSAIAHPGEEMG
jgi:hypothetical protein